MRTLVHLTIFLASACIAWVGLLFLMGPGVAPAFFAWPLAALLACGAVSLVFQRKHVSPTSMIGMALALAACISYLYRALVGATGDALAAIDVAEWLVGMSGVIIAGIGHVPPAQDKGRTDSARSGASAAP